MCLVPLLFRGRNPYYVVDLLNNDCFSCPVNTIMHSKTHLIRLAAGLRSDQRRGELKSTRETPGLRDRERVLKKVGQKVGDEKE